MDVNFKSDLFYCKLYDIVAWHDWHLTADPSNKMCVLMYDLVVLSILTQSHHVFSFLPSSIIPFPSVSSFSLFTNHWSLPSLWLFRFDCPLPHIGLMWFPFSPSISPVTLCPSLSASITVFFIIHLSVLSVLLSEFSSGVADQSDSLLGPRWLEPGRLLQLPAQSLWPGGGAAEVSAHKQTGYVAAVGKENMHLQKGNILGIGRNKLSLADLV